MNFTAPQKERDDIADTKNVEGTSHNDVTEKGAAPCQTIFSADELLTKELVKFRVILKYIMYLRLNLPEIGDFRMANGIW